MEGLPKDLPPKSTVHDYLELWNWDGTLERVHHALYVAVREQDGREASPTAAVIDSQTAKGAQKGGLRWILRATTRARRSKTQGAHPGRGGGIGIVCEIAAPMGKSVIYSDLPSMQFDFTAWCFKKHNVSVRMLKAEPREIGIGGTYDIVLTDAVIEHLPPPLSQTVSTEAMAKAVAPGGVLTVSSSVFIPYCCQSDALASLTLTIYFEGGLQWPTLYRRNGYVLLMWTRELV